MSGVQIVYISPHSVPPRLGGTLFSVNFALFSLYHGAGAGAGSEVDEEDAGADVSGSLPVFVLRAM